MNYKIEINENELFLLAEAVMFELLFCRDRSNKEKLAALGRKLASYHPFDDTNEKPTIKQFDILKPYEDANKNVKFVAVDEVVENK